MHKKKKLISDTIQLFDFIDFAVLFGSTAENRATPLSDLDIGIFTNRDISLWELGLLNYRLEANIRMVIDIVMLNDIYKSCMNYSEELNI